MPAPASVLLAMLATIAGDGVRARRDRAVLALGIAGAFRRSELVGLARGDVELVDEGLRVTIRSSKADQSGAGAVIAIQKVSVFGRSSCCLPGWKVSMRSKGFLKQARRKRK